jgi:hypothetical protein
MIRDIWEFYERVDALIKLLEKDNYVNLASDIRNYKQYNYTSTEILGEIGIILKEMKENSDLYAKYGNLLSEMIEFINSSFR